MSRLIGLPIESPLLPLKVNIPGGIKTGLIIQIQGNISHHAKRFEVNLANGKNVLPPSMSDLVFHFNPRIDQGYVARNSLIGGKWGPEESSNPSHLPFTRNKPFEIMILVEPQQYKVAVDGTHFLEYNHRVPIHEANTLQVMGDLELFKVEFLDSQMELPIAVGFEGLQTNVIQPKEVINPLMPFRQLIPGGIFPGKTICITGRPKPYCTRFGINLEQDLQNENRQICLHFNPRFSKMGDEREAVIVRNSCEKGVWGPEERVTPFFPFYHGFNFDMTILCEGLDFLVAVNGQHLISYRHRLPFEIINTLSIEGDLDVMSVQF